LLAAAWTLEVGPWPVSEQGKEENGPEPSPIVLLKVGNELSRPENLGGGNLRASRI